MKKKIRVGFIGLAVLALSISAYQFQDSEHQGLEGIVNVLKMESAKAESLDDNSWNVCKDGCPSYCACTAGGSHPCGC